MTHIQQTNSYPALHCGLCGRKICFGDSYWYINGQPICPVCLPDFARSEFAACRMRRGEEAFL